MDIYTTNRILLIIKITKYYFDIRKLKSNLKSKLDCISNMARQHLIEAKFVL